MNKEIVRRFNHEVIQEGNRASFEELMHKDFVNRTAPSGVDAGPAGMWNTFANILRPAMPDMTVTILSQVAEGDLVTTHKLITGTQTGPLFGIAPTGKPLRIEVMDMVRIRDGKYFEHWGVNTLAAVIAQLKYA